MKCALWCWGHSHDQDSPGSALRELPVRQDIDPSPVMTRDVQEWDRRAQRGVPDPAEGVRKGFLKEGTSQLRREE